MDAEGINLSGQVAIVTGGGRGLGRVMAQALASSGAAVAVVGRTIETLEETAQAIRESGGKALTLALDVTDQAGVQMMVEQVESQLGSIDLLVNNAGIIGKIGPMWEADPDEWWRVMNVNVRGPFLCTRAVLPGMIRRRAGRIINVASRAAVAPVAVYTTQYNSSKAALVRMTEMVAKEVWEYGIPVFAIDPGLIITDMVNYIVESEEGQQWRPDVARWLEAGNHTPPEVAGDFVAYLASGKADVLSGRFFNVEDNLAELVNHIEDVLRDDTYTLRWRR